jgi:hypothetical protein
MFGLLVFGNLVGIAICLWLAAGYTLENFLAPFGLSTYFHKLRSPVAARAKSGNLELDGCGPGLHSIGATKT